MDKAFSFYGIYTKMVIFMCMLHKKGNRGVMNLCMYPKEKENSKKVLHLFNVSVILYSQGRNKPNAKRTAIRRHFEN